MRDPQVELMAVTVGRGLTQHAAEAGRYRRGSARTVCGQIWDKFLGIWPMDQPRKCRKCRKIT